MTNPKVAHQIELERLYSKNQLIPRIRKEFQDENFGEIIEDAEIPIPFGLDLLVQMALHKRASLTTLIGCLRHHFQNSQLPADMIYKAAEADLVDYDTTLRMFIVKYMISDDVQEELDKFQFPLPMVVRPQKITNNRTTGMLTSGGSVILRNNHHNDDVCLDHLNRANNVRYMINTDTVRMVKNSWKGLDKQKEGETKEDFAKRVRAFEKFNRVAHDVIALLVQEGNEFYLTHKYDKRGRIYCMGYHINPQGNAWNKAIVEFADQEIIK